MHSRRSHFLGQMVALLVFFAAGCSTVHYQINAPLHRHDSDRGYRLSHFHPRDGTERLFVVLMFSGGGKRAAALAYGALEELSRHEIVWQGARKRLIDEVDLVYAVSGGSMTAAYFGLHGDLIFTDFERRFLRRDLQEEMISRLWSVANLWRIASPRFGRADLLAEQLDEALFDGATFQALMEGRKGPFVVINATDMSTGARFEFTQEYFDLLCSDLSRFPIARAVAASSALPIVLAPVTLWNYAGRCGYRPQQVLAAAASGPRHVGITRRNVLARDLASYLDRARRPYVHLLDGGLSDNLAVRSLLDTETLLGGRRPLVRALQLEQVSKVVFVVVNAETDGDGAIDRSADVPGPLQVARAVADVPINRYSYESEQLLHQTLRRWRDDVQSVVVSAGATAVQWYYIDVSLRSLADAGEREFLLGVPTSLHLPTDTVDRLRRAATRLFADSPDFRRLMNDLKN
jgi:NTE family protein